MLLKPVVLLELYSSPRAIGKPTALTLLMLIGWGARCRRRVQQHSSSIGVKWYRVAARARRGSSYSYFRIGSKLNLGTASFGCRYEPRRCRKPRSSERRCGAVALRPVGQVPRGLNWTSGAEKLCLVFGRIDANQILGLAERSMSARRKGRRKFSCGDGLRLR